MSGNADHCSLHKSKQSTRDNAFPSASCPPRTRTLPPGNATQAHAQRRPDTPSRGGMGGSIRHCPSMKLLSEVERLSGSYSSIVSSTPLWMVPPKSTLLYPPHTKMRFGFPSPSSPHLGKTKNPIQTTRLHYFRNVDGRVLVRFVYSCSPCQGCINVVPTTAATRKLTRTPQTSYVPLACWAKLPSGSADEERKHAHLQFPIHYNLCHQALLRKRHRQLRQHSNQILALVATICARPNKVTETSDEMSWTSTGCLCAAC